MKKGIIFSIIAIVIFVGAVFWTSNGRLTTEQKEAPKPVPSSQTNVLGADLQNELASSGQVLGKDDAKVTIVEFSDFQCPFCARYSAETFPQIKKEYIETGKVRYVFRNFPLFNHQFAQKAAESALCAGKQDKFWEMHDQIFANQQMISVSDLKKYAGTLGLKTEDFATCLDKGEKADLVKTDKDLGDKLGVSGTPAFFVNGRLISGAQPFAVFSQVIEEELEKSKSED